MKFKGSDKKLSSAGGTCGVPGREQSRALQLGQLWQLLCSTGSCLRDFFCIRKCISALNWLDKSTLCRRQEAVPGGGSQVPLFLPWLLPAECSAKQLLMAKPVCPGSSHLLLFQWSPLSPPKGCEGQLGDRDNQIVIPLSSLLALAHALPSPCSQLPGHLPWIWADGTDGTLLSFLDSLSWRWTSKALQIPFVEWINTHFICSRQTLQWFYSLSGISTIFCRFPRWVPVKCSAFWFLQSITLKSEMWLLPMGIYWVLILWAIFI